MVACFFIPFLGLRSISKFMMGEMIMTKKKSTFDYMREIRGSWVINPRTRIQENNLKNKKKRRQDEKKFVKDGFE